MKKILLLSTVFYLLSTVLVSPAQSAQGAQAADQACLRYDAIQLQLDTEQKNVDQKLNQLVKQPDVSTPYLIQVGVDNLRKYQTKLNTVCSQITEGKFCLNQQEDWQTASSQCQQDAKNKVLLEKQTFQKLMLSDAAKKKIQFVVNKYRDLNLKFRELVFNLAKIQGELQKLLKRLGDKYAKQQGSEGK